MTFTVRHTDNGTVRVNRCYKLNTSVEIKERDYQFILCWHFLKEKQKEQVLQYIREISDGNFPFRDTSQYPPFKPKKYLKTLLSMADLFELY